MNNTTEVSTFEFLNSILKEMGTVGASGAAYASWSDEFIREEINRVWTDE
jgi:hypothetical protein